MQLLGEVAGARRYADWGLSPHDLEDLKQSTALTLIELASRDAAIADLLNDGESARAFVARCFLNRARELVRDHVRRRQFPLEAESVELEVDLDIAGVDIGRLDALAGSNPSIALTLEVLKGHTSLDAYAVREGISLRTAQRRMNQGVALLRAALSLEA